MPETPEMVERTTDEQVAALADAMWQLLDDMGADGRSVCLAAKAKARVAYEPFRWTDENGDDGLDMALADAEAIIADVYGRPGGAALGQAVGKESLRTAPVASPEEGREP